MILIPLARMMTNSVLVIYGSSSSPPQGFYIVQNIQEGPSSLQATLLTSQKIFRRADSLCTGSEVVCYLESLAQKVWSPCLHCVALPLWRPLASTAPTPPQLPPFEETCGFPVTVTGGIPNHFSLPSLRKPAFGIMVLQIYFSNPSLSWEVLLYYCLRFFKNIIGLSFLKVEIVKEMLCNFTNLLYER